MLNFTEQTGSGAFIIVWSFLRGLACSNFIGGCWYAWCNDLLRVLPSKSVEKLVFSKYQWLCKSLVELFLIFE